MLRSWEIFGSNTSRRPAVLTDVLAAFLSPFRHSWTAGQISPGRVLSYPFLSVVRPLDAA